MAHTNVTKNVIEKEKLPFEFVHHEFCHKHLNLNVCL